LQVRTEPEQQNAGDEDDAPCGRLEHCLASVPARHTANAEGKAAEASEQVQRDTALHPIHGSSPLRRLTQ
jgi:hypothetical protein